MTIREKIEDDIRQAMRSQNRQRLDALRFLKNAIQMVEKDQQKELDDTGVTEVIAKQVRERRESIRMFEQGSRTDLVAKESAELAVLEEYMPPQMSAEQLSSLIREVIEQVGAETPRDKGKVMGRLMPQVRGLADGAQVNGLVDEILGSG
jgi:uncharacterized protein YqeY